MADTAFNDRCARAIGLEVIVVPYTDTKENVLADIKGRGYPHEELVQDGRYWTTAMAAKWDKQVNEKAGGSVGVYYGDPVMMEIRFGCSWGGTRDWEPDTDFNHAVLVRDVAVAKDRSGYGVNLVVECCPMGLSCEHMGRGGVCETTLTPTARQVAAAALKTIEDFQERNRG